MYGSNSEWIIPSSPLVLGAAECNQKLRLMKTTAIRTVKIISKERRSSGRVEQKVER